LRQSLAPEPTSGRDPHRTFASLRFRNYRLYFFSQIVSFSGTWMQSLATAWLVIEPLRRRSIPIRTFLTGRPHSKTEALQNAEN